MASTEEEVVKQLEAIELKIKSKISPNWRKSLAGEKVMKLNMKDIETEE